MLKSDTVMNVFPMPNSQIYHILCSDRTKPIVVQTIMTAITKEEEDKIDELKGNSIRLERGDRVFLVPSNKIHCYGEVDFESDEDLDVIENFKFLNYLGGVGIHIRSDYDYKTHSCRSPKRYPLWTETWSPSLLAKYAHGCIGKPERIILFTHNEK